MIDFEWPWMIWLLPLPLLVRYFMRPVALKKEAALRVPFMQDFAGQSSRRFGSRTSRWYLMLAAIAWILLILAAMRPQWLGDFVEFPVSGRDLMIAVDLSGSMQEEDFILRGRRVDRLTALKAVAGDFIDRRVGDRIGLILFGDRAYLHVPLTLDRETVKTLLNESFIGLPGRATAIGDAIGLAVKRMRERENPNQVLILLTDGANTAGEVEPIEAARLAAREGLKIYPIGIGADELVVEFMFGTRTINPSADLDEEAMIAIAEMTGGQYFRARETRDMERIYAILDELEPVERDVRRFRPRKTLYYWPLAGAFIISLLLLGNSFVRRPQ